MTKSYSNLMKSRFFSPAFNSAIFDGPIRIYFAQFHEPAALKMYFALQELFSERLQQLKDKINSRNVFILIYPDADTFKMSFATNPQAIQRSYIDEDQVIGICGPTDSMEPICEFVRDILDEWEFESVAVLEPAL